MMAEINFEKMAISLAEYALDEISVDGKTLREWIKIFNSGDAISKDAAIRGITELTGDIDTLMKVVARLNGIPPIVNVEHHGEWIHRNDDYNDWYECSNCGYGDEGEVKYDPDDRTPFCPMCGSKMRGWNE